MAARFEALRQTSCRIFRKVYHEPAVGRTGERFLMASFEGPSLKSYWPNKLHDITRYSARDVSSEIPLDAMLLKSYQNQVHAAYRILPVSLHHVYRESISEWRKRRGGGAKKGMS